MARNRKRAKDRRARHPEAASVRAGRADPDRAQLDDSGVARSGEAGGRAGGMPEPIEHAAPDAELAEAQLSVGRPDLDDVGQSDLEPTGEEPAGEQSAGEVPMGVEALGVKPLGVEPVQESDAPGADSLALEARTPAPGAGERHPAHRESIGRRLVGFLQGSWRELQRVQWPDRRQVMQATSVVIGFVIVAGAFLGVADFLAGKLMNLILK